MAKSLLDHAFDYVSGQKEPSKFSDIWNYCVKECTCTYRCQCSNTYVGGNIYGKIIIRLCL